MVAAIFGLLGVIIGGILGAVTQVVLDSQRAKRATRTAARLHLDVLLRTQIAMELCLEEKTWQPLIDNPPDVTVWEANREVLAAGTDWDQWSALIVGVYGIDQLIRSTPEDEADETQSWTNEDDSELRGVNEELEEAINVLKSLGGQSESQLLLDEVEPEENAAAEAGGSPESDPSGAPGRSVT